MGRINRRSLVATIAVLALGLTLAGCAEASTPSSDPTPTESPNPTPGVSASPTESAGMSAFATIDGTWCAADDPTQCMTIDLPDLAYGTDAPSATVADPDVIADSTPCYASSITDTASGMTDVAIFYCPAGYTPDATVTADHDDVAFDRIHMTQNPPYVNTYFREDDLTRALH